MPGEKPYHRDCQELKDEIDKRRRTFGDVLGSDWGILWPEWFKEVFKAGNISKWAEPDKLWEELYRLERLMDSSREEFPELAPPPYKRYAIGVLNPYIVPVPKDAQPLLRNKGGRFTRRAPPPAPKMAHRSLPQPSTSSFGLHGQHYASTGNSKDPNVGSALQTSMLNSPVIPKNRRSKPLIDTTNTKHLPCLNHLISPDGWPSPNHGVIFCNTDGVSGSPPCNGCTGRPEGHCKHCKTYTASPAQTSVNAEDAGLFPQDVDGGVYPYPQQSWNDQTAMAGQYAPQAQQNFGGAGEVAGNVQSPQCHGFQCPESIYTDCWGCNIHGHCAHCPLLVGAQPHEYSG